MESVKIARAFGYPHRKLLFPSYNPDPPYRAPQGVCCFHGFGEARVSCTGARVSFGGDHTWAKREG